MFHRAHADAAIYDALAGATGDAFIFGSAAPELPLASPLEHEPVPDHPAFEEMRALQLYTESPALAAVAGFSTTQNAFKQALGDARARHRDLKTHVLGQGCAGEGLRYRLPSERVAIVWFNPEKHTAETVLTLLRDRVRKTRALKTQFQ